MDSWLITKENKLIHIKGEPQKIPQEVQGEIKMLLAFKPEKKTEASFDLNCNEALCELIHTMKGNPQSLSHTGISTPPISLRLRNKKWLSSH